jgi:hypothetical protein
MANQPPVNPGKDVETMIYNAGRRQVNQDGYRLGAIQAKRLKALNWWVRARIREQEEVNGYGVEWTIAACQEAMLLMDIERTTCEHSSLATMLEKFNPDHFTAGILQFQTYLQSFLGWRERDRTMLPVATVETRVLTIVPGRNRPSGRPLWTGRITRLIVVMFGPS